MRSGQIARSVDTDRLTQIDSALDRIVTAITARNPLVRARRIAGGGDSGTRTHVRQLQRGDSPAYGSRLSSSTITEVPKFGCLPLCRIFQTAMSIRSPQGSRFQSDGGVPQLQNTMG